MLHKPTGQELRVCHPIDGARRGVSRPRQRQGLETSVVNTALSYASVNFPTGEDTEVPQATPKFGG